ncbi:MAG: LamG domain-containing protein [Pseudomonadales bacterium]|nr:LamG domain-containing protein [Pseudomonadales bacterium]MCP5185231.1 LamG domain-containing protein [Pseudomonadales bacterium]
MIHWRTQILPLLLCISLLQACGGGSGATTTINPQTSVPEVGNYTGPAPQTSDVQAFKRNVWDNLVPNNRCGSCHNESQTPRFVRADDINLAYDAANGVVNLADPGQSLMVTKVRGGHNCWLADDNACGDILETYIAAWAGDSLGAPAKTVQLTPPPLSDPGDSRNFPADSAQFAATVYPLLTQFCAGCHSDTATIPQSPFFASGDVDVAYAAAQAKMDLGTAANSRLVLRLRGEFHNCWSDCAANADTMQNAIQSLADSVPVTQLDASLVTSKALKLVDGIVSSSGGRNEANIIALYEFKTGNGNTVFDTSGVEPALNLTLSGGYQWVGGWGIQFTGGKAQGATGASRKLHELIRATGEFSVEVWNAPGNVTQDGPARIVTYSGAVDRRNFLLGQTQYNYDSFVRSDQTDEGGAPQLSTADADEDLQATLQHVVLTYDPVNGRRLYVNGESTGDVDTVAGGLLTDWDDTFALAIGSEVDNSNRWLGTVRLLAIHNRALSPAQILQNFDAGVGERYYLLFNVSDHVGVADAYVVFEVSQFDSYAYLFNQPFFTILGGGVLPADTVLRGMRIGLNGRELNVGQGFGKLSTTLTASDIATAQGQLLLSTQGTVIPLEKGPALDEFFLTFEQLGSSSNVVVEADPVAPPPPPDQPRSPALGIRTFAAIHATMSAMTGVPTTQSQVANTYDLVRRAMPALPALGGFISSQQMGVTQLAISYCSVLVDDTTARAAYFPGLNFNAQPTVALADRSVLIDPLLAHMIGQNLSVQPDPADVTAEINTLVDRLSACGGSCEADRTARITKGACAAVLGSAAMLVH